MDDLARYSVQRKSVMPYPWDIQQAHMHEVQQACTLSDSTQSTWKTFLSADTPRGKAWTNRVLKRSVTLGKHGTCQL